MTVLKEGLFKDDLIDLVDKKISIDEFKSKILQDDESIVIAFGIINRDAAFDLSSFIERGPFAVLDIEVSDELDEEGMYQLFVEMKREPKFIKNFLFMMNKINNVTATKMKDWKFEAYKMAGARPLNSKELKNNIRVEEIGQLPHVAKVKAGPLDESDNVVLERIKY